MELKNIANTKKDKLQICPYFNVEACLMDKCCYDCRNRITWEKYEKGKTKIGSILRDEDENPI